MAKGSDIKVRCLSVFFCLQIVGGYLQVALASSTDPPDLSYADLVKLGQSEKILFGSVHKNLPGQDRVQAMEIELFGAQHQGSYHDRIAAIQSALATGKTNLLMPPMAPELDRSANQPQTHEQGSSSAGGNQGGLADNASPSSAAEDQAKDILREALRQYSAGKYPEAEAGFKKVLSLDKTNTDAYFNLGAMAESRGDLKAALSYYQKALKINPNDSDIQSAATAVRGKLASSSFKPMVSDRMPQPAPSYAKSQQGRGNLKERINEASEAYKSSNYDQAIQILQGVAREAPNEASVQYALSQCYKAKHQYMEARSALTAAISIDPANQLYKDALGDLDRRIANAGSSGSARTSDTISSNSGTNPNESSGPVGQITPFSGVDSTPGWQSTGRTGAYTASGGYFPGFSHGGLGGSSTSNRIERAAIGTISGMAVGALFGGGYRSRGRSAFIGGAMGGLFGLMSGR